MTDTPTPEAVTAEDCLFAAKILRAWSHRGVMFNPAGAVFSIHNAASMLEALAADRDAQTARADAAERRFANSERMLTQAETKLTAAEAKVTRLVEVLKWTDMELAKLSGLWHDVSPRKQIRAIIAEVQG